MTTVTKCALAASIAFAVAMSGASAQTLGGGHKRHADSAKDGTPKPKADEKAYVQAIGSLPDKSYDPWHAMR